MSDVNILIQSLNNGERYPVKNGDVTYDEIRPPTRTALQAARALQQLAQRVEMDQNTIRTLAHELQKSQDEAHQLRQQLKEYYETKTSSSTTSNADGTITGADSQSSTDQSQ